MMLQTKIPTRQFDRYQLPNDPMQVIIHTLSNGLTLFMSVNPLEPRIFTNIAVRAGSKQDPADTTGLAHYMEHMLFKGTQKIGTLDWEKEKVLLQQISKLYEAHRAEKDPELKRKIYSQIDQLSQEAARYAVPNEYDKLATSIGANATNAYTWVDQTVFVNDIPTNELERWMALEAERFSMMALRLFHTELETVYEEFNISQDRDFRKANNALRQSLFPSHPYGTQTTLGRAYDLKNPSQEKIQHYFQTYYVPNNMAIIMSGDFEPDQAIELAEKYFGHYEPKPIPPFTYEEQPLIQGPIRKEVLGNEAPFIEIGWRFGSSQTDDPLMLNLISNLLNNGTCGLFDLHLTQQQKVLSADAWTWNYQDFNALILHGKPKENQSLEEVEQLLLDQIQFIREGRFDEDFLEAIITNDKLQETKELEDNKSRVNLMTEAYILGVEWERMVNRYDWYEGQSKASLVEFANHYLQHNYAVIYKKQGTDPNVVKVEKPPITPITLNRDGLSAFATSFLQQKPADLEPTFVDFTTALHRVKLANGIELSYVENPVNDLFRLDFIFEMGTLSNKRLTLIDLYSELVGTSKYKAADLAMAFFRLGVRFDLHTHYRRTYLTLRGLNRSFLESLQLLEHFVAACAVDESVMPSLIADIFTKRANAKHNKKIILNQAMINFGRFGKQSPYTHRLNADEIAATKAADLAELISNLFAVEHQVYYYGPDSFDEVAKNIERHHHVSANLVPTPANRQYQEAQQTENKVWFVHFPMVQTELLMTSTGTPQFNFSEFLFQDWYNEYFGSGLSSIVFQEIRESKAFAYSCYAYAAFPRTKDGAHYLAAFLGTQPDKISDALPSMLDLIQNMPVYPDQIEYARLSQLKQIASENLKPSQIFWEAQAAKDLGFFQDVRRDCYNRLQFSDASDLLNYHQKYITNRHFNIMVLGDRNHVDFNFLNQFGQVEELSLEDVFGF